MCSPLHRTHGPAADSDARAGSVACSAWLRVRAAAGLADFASLRGSGTRPPGAGHQLGRLLNINLR